MKKKELCISIFNPFTPVNCLCDTKGSITDASYKTRENYILALNQEMISSSNDMDDYIVTGIVFDGGGIQIFSPIALTEYICRIKRRFNMSNNLKMILTCDPYNIDHVKAANYLHLKPTLIDIRLFSSIKDECEAIGRVFPHHSLKEIAQELQSFNLNNIGVQVYCGLPGQTKKSLLITLKECIAYDAKHITLRQLSYNQELVTFAKKWLISNRYEHYADDRFAKEGYIFDFYPIGSTEVLGFGLKAVTQLEGICSRNTSNLDLYLKNSNDYTLITESIETMQKGMVCYKDSSS